MKDEYDFSTAEQGKFYVPITEVSMLKSYEATLDHGQIKWLGERPAIESARVIVTILEESLPKTKRRPPASIAGKGQTLGDIVSPIVDTEDWECLK
ncbi:hypothetical protein [Methylotuvimicrobium sp. KM2]|uniref:hypothetical protein n=1 Tax=Methylotuvimicrobium sp. KM2 TaxID=3133976 RepID=UPI00310196B6